MNRRNFLTTTATGLGIALAGCATPTESSGTSQPTDLEEFIPQRNLELDTPLEYEFELENTDHYNKPFKLTLTLTNTSEDTAYVFGEERSALFYGGTTDNFIFFPERQAETENGVKYQYNDEHEVWVATAGFMMTMEYAVSTLQPGESQSQTLILLHKLPQNGKDANPYPDTLTFESQISVGESQTPDENEVNTQLPDDSEEISFTFNPYASNTLEQ